MRKHTIVSWWIFPCLTETDLNIVRYLKKNNADSGIIIITARNSVNDRIEGLDLGADDYLSKPFHLAELNSRIKAVLRRRKYAGLKTIEIDNLKIIPDNFQVLVDNELHRIHTKGV